jgi:hypothetical protein
LARAGRKNFGEPILMGLYAFLCSALARCDDRQRQVVKRGSGERGAKPSFHGNLSAKLAGYASM